MYDFQLEKYSGSKSRFICPSCGIKNKFTRYINIDTNEYLGETVGRCDRESSCGYHYTPKEYCNDNVINYHKPSLIIKPSIVQPPIDYMSFDAVKRSMYEFDTSNFAIWLISLFGESIAKKALLKYHVGRSKLDNGKANIFWRIDINSKVRTGKIMYYNPIIGKRNKKQTPTWTHVQLKPFNLRLCFFGEHLLKEYQNSSIGIVESEKTAIIASIYYPEYIWLATGGASGCKWREYSVYNVLKNRNVVLFPDFGFYNRSKGITCFQEWSKRGSEISEIPNFKIKVNSLLEDVTDESERVNDYDLADFLVKRDEQTGIALTDNNYPFMWDNYH